MNKLLRRWFEAAMQARGYELKEIQAPLRGFSGCLEYAKSRGLSPKTVFDVGVGNGTPWLYNAFPNSKLVLFEPLSVFDADVAALTRRYDAAVHKVALGRAVGTAEFNVNIQHPTSSSMLQLDSNFADFAAKVQAEHRFSKETVTVDTLDRLNSYEPPYFLKLDVEGAERAVLEGATETLRRTDFLLMEISVMRRLATETTFAEMIHFVDGCGFELFDIPSLSQTSHGTPQLIYLDAAFVPKHSKLWPS
jgi:FkbM family methyltransferase